jgi:hypothetical protein
MYFFKDQYWNKTTKPAAIDLIYSVKQNVRSISNRPKNYDKWVLAEFYEKSLNWEYQDFLNACVERLELDKNEQDTYLYTKKEVD